MTALLFRRYLIRNRSELALRQLQISCDPQAKVDVVTWPIEGKSLAELEKQAQELVRPLKPNLVRAQHLHLIDRSGRDETLAEILLENAIGRLP